MMTVIFRASLSSLSFLVCLFLYTHSRTTLRCTERARFCSILGNSASKLHVMSDYILCELAPGVPEILAGVAPKSTQHKARAFDPSKAFGKLGDSCASTSRGDGKFANGKDWVQRYAMEWNQALTT